MKRMTLELGGKSPNIKFADADLEAAAEGAHIGIHLNQAVACRISSFCRRLNSDSFVAKVVELSRKRRVGNLDPATEQGPQVDRAWPEKS